MRIHDLGPVEVEIDGRRTQLGARPQAVLAVLLSHANERVSVAALAEAVWADSGRVGSRSTLESHVWRVRQVLEPDRPHRQASRVLLTESGGYRLAVDVDQADSLEFLDLAGQSRDLVDADPRRSLRCCEEALALWRGDPFGASADALWAAAAVSRLVEIREQVQIRRVQALLACGEVDRAVVDSGTLIRDLPLNEDVWAQRMTALYRAGRLDEALQAFRTARDLMLEELGLDPGPTLQNLHARILAQDEDLHHPQSAQPTAQPASSPTAAPHPVRPATNLPRRLPPLIGRGAELASLTALIADHGLVTVVGAAGCGKTRLAIEVARHGGETFPDGVFIVDLGSVEQSGLVVELVASVIGLAPAPAGSVEEQLRQHLADQRILLVLDNCEHLAPMLYDLIMEVLDDDSDTHVLATSREPLAVPGEITWPLNPLITPADGDRAGSTALELFLARVREADPTLALDDVSLDLAAEICNDVDGLPLALELAAARVRTASLSEIADQVRTDPGGLRRVGGRGDHRRTLRQVIEWSHRLLEPEERLVHRRLSVLRGAFTRDCAATVAGFAPLSPGQVPDLLESLVNRSLLLALRAEEPGEESTFRQLATVRAHAALALREADESIATIDSRHDWLRGMLARRPGDGRADEHGWYRELDVDFATVRASLESTLVDDPGPLGCFVLSRVSNFWYHRGRMIEGLKWLQLAVPAPVGSVPTDAAMTELNLAAAEGMRGRFDSSRPLFDHALAELREVPPDRLTDVVELLASAALVGALHRNFQMVAVLGRRLQEMAADGDPAFRLMADAVTCFAEIESTPPQISVERATELYHRGLADGVLLTCWICCIMLAALSVRTSGPEEGLIWNHRMIEVQIRLGARPESMPIEGRALLIMATGQLREGVALFAASEAQSRRAGLGWPAMPATEGQLAMARERLGEEAYRAAWEAGLSLTIEEALDLER